MATGRQVKMFQKNVIPLSWGLAAEEMDCLLCVLDPENEGSTILRNVKTT